MRDRTILRTGIIGLVIAAVCCFTPLLVVLLAAVGLSAWLGWLDVVLVPALALFLAMTVYGIYRWRQSAGEAARNTDAEKSEQPS